MQGYSDWGIPQSALPLPCLCCTQASDTAPFTHDLHPTICSFSSTCSCLPPSLLFFFLSHPPSLSSHPPSHPLFLHLSIPPSLLPSVRPSLFPFSLPPSLPPSFPPPTCSSCSCFASSRAIDRSAARLCGEAASSWSRCTRRGCQEKARASACLEGEGKADCGWRREQEGEGKWRGGERVEEGGRERARSRL